MIYMLFSDWRYRDKFADGIGPPEWKYAYIIEVGMELIFLDVAAICMFGFDLGEKGVWGILVEISRAAPVWAESSGWFAWRQS
jgi:hypothetical protein